MRATLAVIVLGPLAAGGVTTFAFVGCSGEPARVTPREASRAVLQPRDLPRTFEQFDVGRLVRADGPRGDSGWKARYKRAGTPATKGALVVESRVDVFASAETARDGFGELAAELRGAAAEELRVRVGDEAVGVQLPPSGAVDFFTIAWRDENAVAALTVNGFELTSAEAAALAQKQQKRLARVAG